MPVFVAARLLAPLLLAACAAPERQVSVPPVPPVPPAPQADWATIGHSVLSLTAVMLSGKMLGIAVQFFTPSCGPLKYHHESISQWRYGIFSSVA